MSEIPNHLICPICQDPFQHCVETPCCSNGFCQKCLDASLKATHGTCPSCRQPCSIFDCRPNVMIQRMVNDLPVGCPWCDAKITHSIVEEHQRCCPARPVPSDGVHCPVHDQPFVDNCPFDGCRICKLCLSIGSHRHHVEELEKEGKEEVIQDQPAVSNLNLSETTAHTHLGLETATTAISYACLLCFDAGIEVNVQSLTAILDAANCHVDPDFIQLFAKTNFDLNHLHQLGFQAHGPSDPPALPDENWDDEESKANMEFEQLRKNYHENLFRFQGIQCRSVPICDHVLQRAKNHIYFLWELKMGLKSFEESETQERPPFSLSLVLDISGSMSGEKLNRAKEAIMKIIEGLRDGDRLHLIKYNDQASLVFENGHAREAERLLALVRGICSSGGTGMSYGIEMGRDLLIRNRSSDPRMIQKMFVFTDGQTYSGITTIEGVFGLVEGIYKEYNIGVSAFGIGTDFNSEMMKCMADAGHGHNFFIENSAQITTILEKAFAGLTRTVATSVVLKLKGLDGNPVRKFGAKSEDLFKGVPLGDIREKDVKQLLLEMEIQIDDKFKDGDTFPVMEYEVSYQRADESIPEGPIRGTVELRVVSTLPKRQVYDPEVLVMLKIGECGKMDKEIVEMLDQRKLDDAIAKKRKVIDALTSVQHLDAIGFAKVLLMRAKKSMKDMIGLKTSSGSGKSYASVQKAARHEAEEEEDGEMGFGLFD